MFIYLFCEFFDLCIVLSTYLVHMYIYYTYIVHVIHKKSLSPRVVSLVHNSRCYHDILGFDMTGQEVHNS